MNRLIRWAAGKTIGIPIDGLIYEVGLDVHLAADVFNAKQMHERYSETPETDSLSHWWCRSSSTGFAVKTTRPSTGAPLTMR
jgi:hypothetical protein